MQPHELVKQVQEAFPKLAHRLSLATDKSDEIYLSHAREPKSRNPNGSGNVSPVTHFIEYCAKYEMAAPGAGMLLASRVFRFLEAEFAELDDATESELNVEFIDQSADVKRWFAKFDFVSASAKELAAFETECDQVMEVVANAKAHARRYKREAEMKDRNLYAVNGGRR